MTKIPSVEQRVEEFTEYQMEVGWFVQQYLAEDMLTTDRTALLTELRDSGLLEERDTSAFRNDPMHPANLYYKGYNTLARDIKVHINDLINPTNV